MDTKRTTPSSKIVALAIVIIAVVVASWLIRFGGKTGEAAPPSFTTSDSQKIYVNETDTDGDGLRDWEESLWGFDPKNPDSDGDGESDSAEKQIVQQQTQEERREFAQLVDPTNFSDWESLPYTEQLTGKVLADYLTLKQSGRALTQEDAVALVENLPKYESPARPTAVVYALSDIRVTSETGDDALREYGNDIGAALKSGGVVKNEMAVLLSFLQTGDNTVFARDMQAVTAQYSNVITALLAVSVPKDAAGKHLGIINTLSLVRNDLLSFAGFAEDPLLVLSTFNSYAGNSSLRGYAFDALRDMLRDADITYTKTDPGYTLFDADTATL